MTTSIVDAESVLVIDLGSINTRAILFDIVDGQYHFISAGVVPSTANAPYRDVSEGIHLAVKKLQETTGRALVDTDGRLVIPCQSDGSGVDRLAVTYSAGPQLRIVTAGLLADVSLESARNLAASVHGKIVDSIGLNDHRRLEVQLDSILQAEPDMIIMAGGTENGAGRSVLKMLELITLVCRMLPQEKRPAVIFAGNRALAKKIKESLEKWTTIQIAPNIRPTIDSEDLGPAQEILAQAVTQIRNAQIGGLQSIGSISSLTPIPTGQAFGRIIRFLSQVYDPARGVLGVDVGSSSTIMAAAVAGKLKLNVFPFGVGSGASQILQGCSIADIVRWLPMHVPDAVVRDYLYQKSLYPAMIPMTSETLSIEQSMARQSIRMAAQNILARWPSMSMSFEPILASGAILSQTALSVQSLLMLLDGLQPVGITSFFLDQNGLIAGLGSVSQINSVLPVQVLESGALLNLGTVISPISQARYGTPILQVRMEYEDGNETRAEVRQGSIVSLPLRAGQNAHIHINPLRRTIINPHGQRGGGSFKITGGVCGAVIDARGRPLILPPDAARRRDLIKKWTIMLGG
ncbi:MAG TPA: glutamate mutase L [Anaerolineaceae bacterium]|nr:glutamate mutase L [Anaerolineaceae bacterium]